MKGAAPVDSASPPSGTGGGLTESVFPPGLGNAYTFAVFNAFSYQIILGSPMVLFAQSLGASATVLGIITGMMPLLVIFQIPAASHVERVGYKRFVFTGWGTRVAFIFGMALVPLGGAFLQAETQVALLLFLLFGFNLSRGISSAAWLPWITQLVPPEIRGRYLARDALAVHVASCVTFLMAGLCLGSQSQPWQFGLLFAFSGVNGAISLIFLWRIPDVPPPSTRTGPPGAVPWRAIAAYGPFRRLLMLSICWAVAYGGLGAFTVAFLKANAGLSEGNILLVTGLAFLGGLAGLGVFESRTDRLGSKPVLTLACAVWAAIMSGWLLWSTGVVRPGWYGLLALELAMGFAYALVTMNLTRLAMVVVPDMGRSHFFALYSVVSNLSLGIAPVAWGVVIDLFQSSAPLWRGVRLDGFTVFFGGTLLTFAGTLALVRRLHEPRARDVEELLRELFRSPQRLWLRLWPKE